jgi:hypothetical protein
VLNGRVNDPFASLTRIGSVDVNIPLTRFGAWHPHRIVPLRWKRRY